MARARLTRVVAFNAAHRYFRPEWSAERNAEVFGACAREHGHGHSYRCHVTVTGPVADDTGMVIALETLDRILREEVRDRLDHRHLNHDVPEFAFGRTIPTAEAIAVYVWGSIARRLPPDVQLHSVRIEEDPDLYAEYFGDG